MQIWWLLCTLVLVSIPYTVWEFKESGYSRQYVGVHNGHMAPRGVLLASLRVCTKHLHCVLV
jgi:hypothetical protein